LLEHTLRTVHTRKLVLAVLDMRVYTLKCRYSSTTYSVVVRRIERAREGFTGTSKLDQSTDRFMLYDVEVLVQRQQL
jgi:hypothetical protein